MRRAVCRFERHLDKERSGKRSLVPLALNPNQAETSERVNGLCRMVFGLCGIFAVPVVWVLHKAYLMPSLDSKQKPHEKDFQNKKSPISYLRERQTPKGNPMLSARVLLRSIRPIPSMPVHKIHDKTIKGKMVSWPKGSVCSVLWNDSEGNPTGNVVPEIADAISLDLDTHLGQAFALRAVSVEMPRRKYKAFCDWLSGRVKAMQAEYDRAADIAIRSMVYGEDFLTAIQPESRLLSTWQSFYLMVSQGSGYAPLPVDDDIWRQCVHQLQEINDNRA